MTVAEDRRVERRPSQASGIPAGELASAHKVMNEMVDAGLSTI